MVVDTAVVVIMVGKHMNIMSEVGKCMMGIITIITITTMIIMANTTTIVEILRGGKLKEQVTTLLLSGSVKIMMVPGKLITINGHALHPLLSQTFSLASERLPTIAQVKSYIYTDRQWAEAGEFDREKHLQTILIRESYVGQSFVLLTDEFLRSLQALCCDFKSIVELGAGIGWLGHWLGQYGVGVQALIDNKSWAEFSHQGYLEIVQQMDSFDYLMLHPEVELFILSWPQEDDLAARIWQALRPGQYLLYIGEDKGGCTADNDFFGLIHGHEVVNNVTWKMKQSFLSFDDFHDQPHLYRKR
jgi:hypothetical protein